MPELPEVETVRRGLEREVVGRRIGRVEVNGARSVRRQDPGSFVHELEGRRVDAARRRGKYLYAELDDGAALVVHLRMSGQLRLAGPPPLEPRSPHTHVVVGLGDGSELRFVDPRTFGELFVTSERSPDGLPSALAGLGADPLVDGVDDATLEELAACRRTALKSLLLDQSVIAGVGNIYGDEVCFHSGLRPDRRTESLRGSDAARLGVALRDVLTRAVEKGGSTLRDARYVGLRGAAGSYQHDHAVYGRAGRPCPRCGTLVERTRVGGRSAHFCPRCQR
ncbi:MAG: bifunctional DNA-formamidopyrimidine glycosylase/DNA-(apurinic or apyrimidinic site) lyase [Actinomycetota bacterium]|nr:bifunctional DNA-formamidopyrimidine glycosylase/DNA-(apurinic or apyrimidinic site) lyase [Actinomycetota bacterium]